MLQGLAYLIFLIGLSAVMCALIMIMKVTLLPIMDKISKIEYKIRYGRNMDDDFK